MPNERPETQDFLVEIGTEELPPASLQQLGISFESALVTLLEKQGLTFGTSQYYATPRRLAVKISDLVTSVASVTEQRRGPSKKAAYDQQGEPTKAALGFAKSCGIDVSDIDFIQTEKGEWLSATVTTPAQRVDALIGDMVKTAIKQLPIAKPMRWGAGTTEFIRPVHWVLMLFGDQIIKEEILGKVSSNQSYGHRFHQPQAITIASPNRYASQLEQEGKVIADFELRRQRIEQQVTEAVSQVGHVMLDPELLNEVTAIVEWPVALLGQFDTAFLSVPAEALVSAMQKHQRCFPVTGPDGKLLAYFVTVANIASSNPHEVIIGNERVIRARLSDAKFFYQTDSKHQLEDFRDRLENVIFQRKLGSLLDKTYRIKKLAIEIAKQSNSDEFKAERAAQLCKADLMSEMVGEFPDLQGTMGYYYAKLNGEADQVAVAIKEHYQPRFSGDSIPGSLTGCIVALADKIDTLVGIFGIQQIPTGDKDPYALRRAALGILKIMIERELDLDLKVLFKQAFHAYPKLDNLHTVDQCLEFVMERLKSWYSEQGISAEVFASVYARYPTQPLDFDHRIKAVESFQTLPQAKALAAANKRVSNIFKKLEDTIKLPVVNEKLFQLPAEENLAQLINRKQTEVIALSEAGEYAKALNSLAELQQPIDLFFDDVMVMADDEIIRENRLALLKELRQLFLQIADISYL